MTTAPKREVLGFGLAFVVALSFAACSGGSTASVDSGTRDAGGIDSAPDSSAPFDGSAPADASPDAGAERLDAEIENDAAGDGGAPRPYVRQLSLGWDYSCALAWDGSIHCWGNGTWGQLGDGMARSSLTPTTVSTISDAIQISAGGGMAAFACAVRADHSVWCWGANGVGMLGFPDASAMPMASRPIAVPSLPSNVLEVAAGWLHACARRSDGFISCWGYNGAGELGDGTTMARTGPVLSGAHDAIQVAAGYNHSCAALARAAQCWGSNTEGQLGLGDGSMAPYVMGLTDAIQLSGYANTVCALRATGTVACWGQNDHGQVGDGTTMTRNAPSAALGLSDAIAVVTGDTVNCALGSGGQISCWGWNASGEFGDGTTIPSFVPVTVPGIPGAQLLAMGQRHVCAANEEGVWCWGNNAQGQLGDGTTTDSLVPVRVLVL